MKAIKIMILALLVLQVSCSTDKTIDNKNTDKESPNYREAHTFIGDSAILKDGYLPKNYGYLPYKECNFEKQGEGYYYTSFKDTPYVSPMWLRIINVYPNYSDSFEEGYHTHGMSMYTTYSSGVSNSKGGSSLWYLESINSGKKDKIHTCNLFDYNRSGGSRINFAFGEVDKDKETITFEIYFLETKGKDIPNQIYSKSKIMGWINSGKIHESEVIVLKKLENITFKYVKD